MNDKVKVLLMAGFTLFAGFVIAFVYIAFKLTELVDIAPNWVWFSGLFVSYMVLEAVAATSLCRMLNVYHPLFNRGQ